MAVSPVIVVLATVATFIVGMIAYVSWPSSSNERQAQPTHHGGQRRRPNSVLATYGQARTRQSVPGTDGQVKIRRSVNMTRKQLISSIPRIDISEVVPLPDTWTRDDILARVDEGSLEYRTKAELFLSSLGNIIARVLQVFRVQNKQMYQRYIIYRSQISKKLNQDERDVEQRLWHGTEDKRVKSIAELNFNRGYAGERRKDGYSSLGKGCYFAVRSEYSAGDGYATANGQGESMTFLVRVVTGDYCKGKEGLRSPPAKPEGGIFDSVVDKLDDPTMFAVFQDPAAYPEYLIKYEKLA